MAAVVLLPLALREDCAGFAGGAFLAPNDRRLGEAVGSSRLAGAVTPLSQAETAPA